jgi:hypothetical protein
MLLSGASYRGGASEPYQSYATCRHCAMKHMITVIIYGLPSARALHAPDPCDKPY